jgi:hypothetical protein
MGKVDELGSAQHTGAGAAFGLSAVPSARITIPTFDHAENEISEEELDRIIAGASQE